MTNTKPVLNVLGGLLDTCSCNPMTGYLRDGFCNTTPDDFGTHVFCAIVTKTFLEYSFSKGNDLIKGPFFIASLNPFSIDGINSFGIRPHVFNKLFCID